MKKLIVAMLVGLLVAACGGGQKRSNPKPSVTTDTVTVTTHSSSTVPPPAPVTGVVTEAVRSSNAPGGWTSAAAAPPGSPIQFRTTLEGRKAADVQLVFARGPRTRLTVTATVNGHVSRATVSSANGVPLTLLQLHYTCTAPPDPSFCPAQGVSDDGLGDQA